MSEYFPKPKSLGANMRVEIDLSNYATKADFKNVTEVHTSDFAKKAGLANLKSDGDKLDIDELKNIPNNLSNLKSKADKLDIQKLETTPVNLSKLSNIIKTDLVKKTEYNELVRLFIINHSFIIKTATKMKCEMRWLFDYFLKFLSFQKYACY